MSPADETDRRPSTRTIPIWFRWDGEAILFATARAQKLIALRAKPEVAISIEEHVLPYKIFYLRGVASIELLDNPPEYAAAAERYLGLEQGRAYVDRLRGQRFAQIRVPPTWANVIDFETRFPSALAD